MMEATARALALTAMALSPSARETLLRLLPSQLSAEVNRWLRRSADLLAAPASELETALAAIAQPAETDEQDESADTDEILELPEVPDFSHVCLACVLAASGPDRGASLLVDLPLHQQGEAVARLATATPRGITRQLPPQQRQLLEPLRAGAVESWGVHAACTLLRAIGSIPPMRRALLSTVEADADAAAIIQSHLFDFDDLTRLRDTEFQMVLLHIDNETLARALVGAGQSVTDAVFANASERRHVIVHEELELWAEATPDEVERARAEIMGVVRLMYERGEIRTWFGVMEATSVEPPDVDEEDEEPESPEKETAEEESETPKPVPVVDWRRRLVIALVVMAGFVALVPLVVQLSSRPEPGSPTAEALASRRSGPASRVLLARASQDSTATDQEAGESTADRTTLDAGERMRSTGEIDAVLEFPAVGDGIVQVAPGAEVSGLGGSDIRGQGEDEEQPARGLYLRIGRVTVTAVRAGFPVRSPSMAAVGAPGSRFIVRVVLDASTTVECLQGRVTVSDLSGRVIARLESGDEVRISPAGEAD